MISSPACAASRPSSFRTASVDITSLQTRDSSNNQPSAISDDQKSNQNNIDSDKCAE
ncbi:hypothetical protein [Nostoc sp. 'Peltigera membranacea cyanobiont' 232]|uniref:hypothetical protein n=1 Tax=Nostoc sp. 'Peltigera membranacea cyanobiont' 232 TaxID=2014531 RepID=UPI001677F5A6|nr:hypothetical protein [Nostoc sp. 'Peltigera membranacea cyanobiont' 232]